MARQRSKHLGFEFRSWHRRGACSIPFKPRHHFRCLERAGYLSLASRRVRMWAIVIHASAEATVFSQSLDSLRQRPSQAKVHPAARQHGEALGLVGTLDDFHRPLAELRQSPLKLVARICPGMRLLPPTDGATVLFGKICPWIPCFQWSW